MNEVERVFFNKWQNKKLKNKSFLSKKIRSIKNYLKKLFQREKSDINKLSFSGWGMTTTFSQPPWRNSNSKYDENFNNFHDELSRLINNKEFFLICYI